MPLPAGEASRPPTPSVYRIKPDLDADGGSAVAGDAIAIGGLGVRPPRRRGWLDLPAVRCTHASLHAGLRQDRRCLLQYYWDFSDACRRTKEVLSSHHDQAARIDHGARAWRRRRRPRAAAATPTVARCAGGRSVLCITATARPRCRCRCSLPLRSC
jgi:hypothetical protein